MNIKKFTLRPWLLAFFFFASAFIENGIITHGWSQTQATPKVQSVREKFEQIAVQLEFFESIPFLNNCTNISAIAYENYPYFQLLNQVLDPEIAVTEIAALRHHKNPKVRTLALAALFHRNDLRLLPLIVELSKDTAPTFPRHKAQQEGEGMTEWLLKSPLEKQSVGDVAKLMVEFYRKHTDLYDDVARSPQSLRKRIEYIAKELKIFNLHSFLYNRANYSCFLDDKKPTYLYLLNRIIDPKIAVAKIAPLRHHENPKVRTLALAALFHRNDPHLLPLIVELSGDTAPTFPKHS